MKLTKEQVSIVELVANRHGIKTLGNWLPSRDFAAFIVGDEPPSAIMALVKEVNSKTGFPTISGRLDDLDWQNPIHAELEWLRIDYKVACPAGAKMNGITLATLPQFTPVKVAPRNRRFSWKFAASRPVGAALL